MGWPSWTVHYSQGKGITQTFFHCPWLFSSVLPACVPVVWRRTDQVVTETSAMWTQSSLMARIASWNGYGSYFYVTVASSITRSSSCPLSRSLKLIWDWSPRLRLLVKVVFPLAFPTLLRRSIGKHPNKALKVKYDTQGLKERDFY